MLHARIEVAQVLDMFQVRAVLSEFEAGIDPVHWISEPYTLTQAEIGDPGDALSTVLEIIRLWSEQTISQ